MELLSKVTRFRAYQIGIPGSLFSYYDGDKFNLIDANLTEMAIASLREELTICNKKQIDRLHITSWDNDHCTVKGIEFILRNIQLLAVDIPGYSPDTENGKQCYTLIRNYINSIDGSIPVEFITFDPMFIKTLPVSSFDDYNLVAYWPRDIVKNHNDNSSIVLFRTGSFTVLSLGDVESPEIADFLLTDKIFTSQIDVMILAHHGADNGFTTSEFIEATKPKIAVCSSDYDNKHDHPRPEIREILKKEGVPLYTTKTGDVIVQSIPNHTGRCKVINLKNDSTEFSSGSEFNSKRLYYFNRAAKSLL